MPIRIDAADDPRIEAYRDIRERDRVGRLGQFVAEGRVVVEQLLRSRSFRPLSLLIAERFAGEPWLDAVPPGVPVHVAPQAVLERIVGFPMHRGVLALGMRTEPADPAALLASLPARAIVVVLVGIANHDNLGGIFRNAAAFGAAAVLVDPTCCDPLYRKALRVSVGAALIVPFARWRPGEDGLALCTAAGFTSLALSPAGTMRLDRRSAPDRVALWFGTEGPGLPTELLREIEVVAIPMANNFDSLNVATASGIVLHHFSSFMPMKDSINGDGPAEA